MRKLVMLVLCGLWLGCQSESSEEREKAPGTGGGSSVETTCTPSEMPTCCQGCSDMLTQPVCTAGSWSCPEGSTDQRECPSTEYQLACSPPIHPQAAYTYPGCANEDYGCPRLKTVYCALELLRTEHAQCQQDSDCVPAGVDGRCTGYGQCSSVMVSAAGRKDFKTKAEAEVLRYCTESPICASTGSCPDVTFVPRCREGLCVGVWPDAQP